MIKVIVLDCDGVILESVEVKTMSFAILFQEEGETAVRKMVAYHLANGGVSRFDKFAWFYREVLNREITDEEMEDLDKRFTQQCFDKIVKSTFVPGAFEFISKYHERIPLYVASGTPEVELVEIFKARNLSYFFHGIYGSPSSKRNILNGIISEAGISAVEALMVGDSSTDIDAAESVGMQFYGRGKFFAGTKWSWDDDLWGLGDYIEKIGYAIYK